MYFVGYTKTYSPRTDPDNVHEHTDSIRHRPTREPPHILYFCQTMNEFYMTALDIVVVVVVLVVVVAAFYADKWIKVIARNSIVVGSVLWLSPSLSLRKSNIIANSKCKATSNRFCATAMQQNSGSGHRMHGEMEKIRNFKDETGNALPMIAAVETMI